MNIIFLGQSSWEAAVDVRDISSSLARRGHRVLYVEPERDPANWADTLRAARPRSRRGDLRVVAGGVFVLGCVSMRALGRAFHLRRRLITLRTRVEELRLDAPVLVTERPVTRLTLGAIRPVGIIYFPADDPPDESPSEALEATRREETFLPRVDLVLARTEDLARRCSILQPRTRRQERGAGGAVPGYGTAGESDSATRADAFESCLAEAMSEGRKRRPQRLRLYRPFRSKSVGPSIGLLFRVGFVITRWAGRVSYRLRRYGRTWQDRPDRMVRSILVSCRCDVGDLVVLTPALAALRSRYPRARIVLGVQADAGLPTTVEHVDEVREIDFLSASSGPLARFTGAVRLFTRGFDLVLAADRDRVRAEGFLSGAPFLVGLEDGHPLQALNHRVRPVDPTQHDAENALALVDALVGQRMPRRMPELEIGPVPASMTTVVTLVPSAPTAVERWPAEHFSALADSLLSARPQIEIALVGGPGDGASLESIRTGVDAALRGRITLSRLSGDFSQRKGLIARSSVVVTGDTATIHLARALGAPLVAIIGPRDLRRRGPHPGGRGRAVALGHDVPCSPCRRISCERHYCMRGLAVAKVVAEVTGLLDGEGRPSGGAAVVGFAPLETRRVRSDLGDLKRRGFDVPRVSALVLAPSFAPEAVDTSDLEEKESSTDLESRVVSLKKQDYPDLEIVVAETGEMSGAETLRPHRRGVRLRRLRVGSDDPLDAWRQALATTRGEFIVSSLPGDIWAAGEISTAVATLIGDSTAAAIVRPDGVHGAASGAIYRRAVLEDALSDGGAPAAAGIRSRLQSIEALVRGEGALVSTGGSRKLRPGTAVGQA